MVAMDFADIRPLSPIPGITYLSADKGALCGNINYATGQF